MHTSTQPLANLFGEVHNKSLVLHHLVLKKYYSVCVQFSSVLLAFLVNMHPCM